MEKVCYVVQCSAGQYEDYHSWIAGIYLNPLDAEELKSKITAEVEIIRNTPAPYNEDELEHMLDEQADKFYKWLNENEKAVDFNSANVIEYPLGKPVKTD